MHELNCLKLSNYSIEEQLRLEEALLRVDNRNWCIINQGSPPAIVLGISAQPQQVIDEERVRALQIPLLRRYSGGGTVIVDHQTIFVSLIASHAVLPFPCFPRRVMDWSGQFYVEALDGLDFAVRENDYVIGQRKFGGNAQSITKDRFVHHSSLLWSFDPTAMELLRFPPKVPDYRGTRSHNDFLCSLDGYCDDRNGFEEAVWRALGGMFKLRWADFNEALALREQPHRQATTAIVQ